jgi:hypothetical protein
MKRCEIKIILCQESGFDNFANLALQLEREGIEVEFIWPWYAGPLQGIPENANSLIKLHNKAWNLRSFKSWLRWEMFILSSKVREYKFFAQTPYIDDHYHPRTVKLFGQRSIGYLNYGINLEASNPVNFDLEIFKQFSPMLVANHVENDIFIAKGAKSRNLVVTGMPGPFEVFLQNKARVPNHVSGKQDTLLWAPHWNREWSTWELVLPELLRFSRQFRDVRVLIRAHPLLTQISGRTLPRGYMLSDAKSEKTSEQLKELLGQSNVQISGGTMVSDCLESDWLLTDGISILAYWAATGRPFAVTRKLESPEFSGFGRKLLNYAQIIDTERPGQVFEWLSERATNPVQGAESESGDQGLVSEAKHYFQDGMSPGRIFADWLRGTQAEANPNSRQIRE